MNIKNLKILVGVLVLLLCGTGLLRWIKRPKAPPPVSFPAIAEISRFEIKNPSLLLRIEKTDLDWDMKWKAVIEIRNCFGLRY